MTELPWGTNKLKKLGACIRDGTPAPPTLPSYDEVMLFYNDLAAEAQAKIDGLDWGPLLGERVPEVTSRPKTIDTLRQKLQREPTTQLPSIQDIAGVRFEAEMTLDEQDAVANAIAGLFDHDLAACTRDLRDSPHSGYRAVHLWLRLPARLEVQIRTHLQGQWANTYEAVADVFGREIRYDEMPVGAQERKVVEALQMLSLEGIKPLEKERAAIQRLYDKYGRLDVDPLDPEYDALLKNVEKMDAFEAGVQSSLADVKKVFDTMRHTKKG
jgi:ppGpp synthetase/RelA/SpoT-type nucleotidyltranferase